MGGVRQCVTSSQCMQSRPYLFDVVKGVRLLKSPQRGLSVSSYLDTGKKHGERLPGMVWIMAGRLPWIGTVPLRCEEMAKRSGFITINYRLGVFGSLPTLNDC